MNFFETQDRARRTTRRLVIAYIIATLLIVAGVTLIVGFSLYTFTDAQYAYTPEQFAESNVGILAAAALITALVIVGGSLFKTAVLSSGGGAVARQLGGTQVSSDVTDPLRRRLRNVVEEMSIASGVAVPEIYVLEREAGINAFAAGSSPNDAAVAVTRGALEMLDRDELQGVIAHEFSHILNGDMRLNIRLMGVLFGIMVLALFGRFIVRGVYYGGSSSSRRDGGAAAIVIIGFGLLILGYIGMFFARIIKAGVSRQREYLADASAVQFTRQTEGIANALKKIGGYGHGSRIEATDPEEVSHMLFGSGARLAGLFATHPPLVERIQALQPNFRESDFAPVDRRTAQRGGSEFGDAVRGFAPGIAAVEVPYQPASLAETVGNPSERHVRYARQLRESIPESLYSAAHSSEFSYLLVIALVLDSSGKVVDRQLAIARDQMGPQRARLLRRYYEDLQMIGVEYRLPLLEIAFPALRERPADELAYVVSLATRMIETDGEIDLYEFCYYRILTSSLGAATGREGKQRKRRRSRRDLQAAAIDLLRVLATLGHRDDAARRAAYKSGIETLGEWSREFPYETDGRHVISLLDHSFDVLTGLKSEGKESLVRAISATAGYDGKLTVREAEIIRAVCATLDFPLPPIIVQE
ncbi:MAG: M48 family metallopeptidase [Woeseiaceae bacterium]